ncbi:MAG: DNA repair protein RecO [Lachnospiraceae bacterium]|nr:DNA repair protein RecO [Lachnospiraceae bacterium]
MSDLITVTGMVLSSMPIGEYDRRLVILTSERGKISAFAKGARRPNSPLLAGSRPFSFGQMQLYEGRSSYTVRSLDIRRYFEELATDVEAVCYGTYFMEFADYYGREGIDEREMINLLYASLLALSHPEKDRRLLRAVFELRAMMLHGEYAETPLIDCGEGAAYAWNYCLTAPTGKLYAFRLTEEAEREFIEAVEALKRYYIDRGFKSLEVLESLGL